MSSKKTATIVSSLLFGAAIAALLLCVQLPASAQTWTVIHTFNGLDRGSAAGVTLDATGNLYGTTFGGGYGGTPSYGTVFKLTHTGTGWDYTRLHFFNAFDGYNPGSRVTFGPDGALYGTTSIGGNGYGTVYRLQPPVGSCRSANCQWRETVLHAFQGGSDGGGPSSADLAFDQQGNIYGAAGGGAGGSCNGTCGVVYKLTRSGQSWSYSVIYTFQEEEDGSGPDGVVQDASGNLYGATFAGGDYSSGVVFKLTPSGAGWTQSVLYDFPNPSEGADPEGGLIFDRSGNLYGTARYGGQYGTGTVYELTPANGGWNFGVLASLQDLPGYGPVAQLAMDDNGALYGTVLGGYVFKLTPSGNSWILSQLGEGNMGMSSSVTVDSNGVVYGTDPGNLYNYPSVFEITQ